MRLASIDFGVERPRLHAPGTVGQHLGDDSAPECGRYGAAAVRSEHHRPVPARPVSAEPDGPLGRGRSTRSRTASSRTPPRPSIRTSRRSPAGSAGSRTNGSAGSAGRGRRRRWTISSSQPVRSNWGWSPRASSRRKSSETRCPCQGARSHRAGMQRLGGLRPALPKPVERRPSTTAESRQVEDGRKLFASTGCASCHTPKLGNVEGLYSDLLLHDMGPSLGDTGQYGVFDPSLSEDEIIDEEGPITDAATASPATAAPVPSFVPGLQRSVTVIAQAEPVPTSFAKEVAEIEAELGAAQEATAVAPQRPAAAADAVPPVIATGSIVLPPLLPTATAPVVFTAQARRQFSLWRWSSSGPRLGRPLGLSGGPLRYGGSATPVRTSTTAARHARSGRGGLRG